MNPMPTSVFFQEFTTFLENIVLCSEPLIIAGGFNIRVNSSTLQLMIHIHLPMFLKHLVAFPTHNSGHSLDLIITRSCNDIMVCSSRPTLFLSDHCFSECSLKIPSSSTMVKEIFSANLKTSTW